MLALEDSWRPHASVQNLHLLFPFYTLRILLKTKEKKLLQKTIIFSPSPLPNLPSFSPLFLHKNPFVFMIPLLPFMKTPFHMLKTHFLTIFEPIKFHWKLWRIHENTSFFYGLKPLGLSPNHFPPHAHALKPNAKSCRR